MRTAIVAADVVGYSRLMGRDESGTLPRLRKNRSEYFEPVLTKYGGRLVKLTGDGALVAFASAVDALSAAIDFQQAMAEANCDQPAEPPFCSAWVCTSAISLSMVRTCMASATPRTFVPEQRRSLRRCRRLDLAQMLADLARRSWARRRKEAAAMGINVGTHLGGSKVSCGAKPGRCKCSTGC